MNFYIKQGATLPLLALEFTDNGYISSLGNEFYDRLENAQITFSMIDEKKCSPIIKCSPAQLVEVENCIDKSCAKKYLLVYQFNERQTSKLGTYLGDFQIVFYDNGDILKVPIKNELRINVVP